MSASVPETWRAGWPDQLTLDEAGRIAALATDHPVSSAPASGGRKSPRADLSVVRVAGEDAADFLHAQFAADVSALADGSAVLTAWCSPQGKVLFMPWLLRIDEAFLLLVPHDNVDPMIRRLRMFVLRAAVTIDSLQSTHAVFEVRGESKPCELDALHASTATGRRFVVANGPQLRSAWDAVKTPMVSEQQCLLEDIVGGQPRADAALSDRFLPQELGLDTHEGLSFDKGCFPGQEIIARVRYRGRVKRQLAVLRSEQPVELSPGDRLYVNDAPHATVVASAVETTGAVCLAVLDDGVDAVTPEGISTVLRPVTDAGAPLAR